MNDEWRVETGDQRLVTAEQRESREMGSASGATWAVSGMPLTSHCSPPQAPTSRLSSFPAHESHECASDLLRPYTHHVTTGLASVYFLHSSFARISSIAP